MNQTASPHRQTTAKDLLQSPSLDPDRTLARPRPEATLDLGPPPEVAEDVLEDEGLFSLTFSVRRKVEGESPYAATNSLTMLWGAIAAPRKGTIAVGTLGMDRAHGSDFIVCGKSGQRTLAESCVSVLCHRLDSHRQTIDPEAYSLFSEFDLGTRLGSKRGFLLCKPYCYKPGSFDGQGSQPLWAIVLWPSEIDTLRSIGIDAFVAAMNASGLDFIDIERDSMSGEKLPERRLEPRLVPDDDEMLPDATCPDGQAATRHPHGSTTSDAAKA